MSGWDVNCIGLGIVTDGETQIANGAAEIGFHEDILTLQIAMSDAGLAGALFALLALRLAVLDIRSHDIHVEMSQSSCDCQRHEDHRSRIDGVSCEEVKQRSVLVVVRDEPQLGPRAVVLVVGSDEAENVVVAQHRCLVNFGFSRPRALLPAREDFHGNALAAPTSAPNLTESSISDNLLQLDLPGY